MTSGPQEIKGQVFFTCGYQRAPNPPEFAQPRLSRVKGRSSSEGANLGVFVPIWPVITPASS